MKKTCKEESNGKLLNIISSVFLKTETFVSLYERGKQFLTNTFNVRSSKEYLRGPGTEQQHWIRANGIPLTQHPVTAAESRCWGAPKGRTNTSKAPQSQPQHLPLTAQGHQRLFLASTAPGGKAQPVTSASTSELPWGREGRRKGRGKTNLSSALDSRIPKLGD